jgi:hypothetical protein
MEPVIMATLEAKYLFEGKNYAEVGENVLISEDGETLTKHSIEDSYDGTPFDEVVDPADEGIEFEVDDAVVESANMLDEMIQAAIQSYIDNPPESFEEDLDYEFNDDDPSEWLQGYEDVQTS